MKQNSVISSATSERDEEDIRQGTRKRYSPEEDRIVLDGLRGQHGSDHRQIFCDRRGETKDPTHLVLISGGLVLMQQVPDLDGLVHDRFSLQQDCLQ